MSAEKSFKEAKKSEKMKIIRSERFNDISKILNLHALIEEHKCSIINVSESGVAVRLLDNKTKLEKGDKINLILKTENGKKFYEGRSEIVRVRVVNDKIEFALRYLSKFVERNLINAIELIDFTYQTVEGQFDNYKNIPPDFRVLIQDVKHYLKYLKTSLDEIEKRIEIQGTEIQSAYLSAIEYKVGPQITERLLSFSEQLTKYYPLIEDRNTRKNVTEYFRSELNSYYLTSPYINRAIQKPLGYAGDYEMMNQIYRDSYEGNSLFGKIIHKYTINEWAGKAVRFRKHFLKEKIRLITESRDDVIIASLACGPAQEVKYFVEEYSGDPNKKIKFVLIDQDVEALLNAKRNITEIILQKNLNFEVECIPFNIKDIIENTNTDVITKYTYDFVYTAGLYDYLSQPVARLLTEVVYSWLGENGALIVGNFHPNNPTRAICEFGIDWRLVHRNEAQMLGLLPQGVKKNYSLTFDDFKVVLYLEMEKKSG